MQRVSAVEGASAPLSAGPEPVPASPGPRVLVVGINYAPEHAGISPYTTRASEHLARQGAQVLVLVGGAALPALDGAAGATGGA